MNDRLMRDLLHEVADDAEPGDRLDAIRSATAIGGRRDGGGRGWWAAGGVGLVAASVVTAVALTTGSAPRGTAPGPAETPSTKATATNPITSRLVPVYFVGDTPSGPRLYREFQRGRGPMSAETFALDAALGGDAIDPDYRSPWPTDAAAGALLMAPDLITITLTGDLHDRPPGWSQEEAMLAVEQVVRTAQGSYGNGRVPVRLLLNDSPTDQVLGVPTSEPLGTARDLAVLAQVSISDPFEGQVADNDEPFVVEGVGNSFEGTIVTSVQTLDGRDVVDPHPATAGWEEDRLYPWSVTLDLGGVAPGTYVVRSRTDDPSGAGRVHEDTRTITVVD